MIIKEIRAELKKHIDLEYKESVKRFFKENQEISHYGVRTAVVRKIAKNSFKKIKDKSKEEIFRLCVELLQSGLAEERGIASIWASFLIDQYSPDDFPFFESWLKKYVKNWGACDALSCFVLGPFILKFPEYIAELKKWTESKNRWERRAAAVSMILPAKKREFLADVFVISNLLLLDEDDMVQKGYGWLLKVASNEFPDEVFQYVLKNKDKMPRTALRYAIEKMPTDWKKKAMARN